MPSFSHSIDMTQAAIYAEQQVAGKPLGVALYVLGGLCQPPSVDRLRQQARGYFRSPLLGFMGVYPRQQSGEDRSQGASSLTPRLKARRRPCAPRCTATTPSSTGSA